MSENSAQAPTESFFVSGEGGKRLDSRRTAVDIACPSYGHSVDMGDFLFEYPSLGDVQAHEGWCDECDHKWTWRCQIEVQVKVWNPPVATEGEGDTHAI